MTYTCAYGWKCAVTEPSVRDSVGEEPTDEALMKAYVTEGDPDAFATVFRRYASRLMAFFVRMVRSQAVAHDLVQQTFLQVHRARRDYRQGAPFRPWLYTIALNLRRAYFRRRGRRPETPYDAEKHPEPAVESKVSSVRDRLVRRALADLNEGQREVIVLHWYEGYSFPEIAVMLNASLSAVKVRAHRGYERLKILLKEASDESS